jgi:phage terminase large subunit GpA-like protein
MPFADASTVILQAAVQAMLPDAELRLDEWSEAHVIIPKGGAFEGPYRLSHTPYARRILQALSPTSAASIVAARVASQMLKTQVAINACLGWMAEAPANILALEPTTGLSKRLSARIGKSIGVCRRLDGKVAPPRSRDKRNTIDTKEFDGGTLYVTTAGSDANLAEIAARYLFCDEVNREGWRSGDEGNRIAMALARLTTYEGISKAYIVSSPTIVGSSEIDDWFERGTQEHYHVPCPHCGHLHELVRGNFRYDWDTERQIVRSAYFVCPECGGCIEEHDKSTMLPDEALGGQARWVAYAEGDGETLSFTLSSYYAPLGSITWRRLAKELALALEAKERGDDTLLMVYENTREGVSHNPGEVTSTAKDLQTRANAEGVPPRIVPDRALVLTMFTDTQDNRLEVTTQAWAPGLETWTVDHRILWGSPADPPDQPGSVWQQLEEVMATPYAHASGSLIYASAFGIDSGGHHTQDVYNFGARQTRRTFLVTKGANVRNRPIIASKPSVQDIDWQGKRVEEGVRLWTIGTDTAKDHIFNRLKMAQGPGALHWFAGLDLEAYEQLLIEKPVVRWSKGRKIREYVKPNGARNEFLDCLTGNLAMAHHLGLHRWGPPDWAQLRANLIPKGATPDLFAAAAVTGVPMDPPAPPAAHTTPPNAARIDAPTQQPIAPAPPTPAPAPITPPPPQYYAPQPTGRRMISRGIR